MPRDSLADSSRTMINQGDARSASPTKALEIHRTDRSSCLENPRPKGGIPPIRSDGCLILTLNQNRISRKN